MVDHSETCGSATGACFVTVSASDRDDGLNALVTYGVDWNDVGRPSADDARRLFAIDADSGAICLNDELDFEESPSAYVLPLVARDAGAESLSGRTTLTVNVDDVNDNRPSIVVDVVSGSAGGGIEVAENGDGGLSLALVTVFDADSGRNGRVACALNTTSSSFQLVEIYDRQFHVAAVAPLDREETDSYALAIHCRDLGEPALSTSAVVTVRSVVGHARGINASKYM